MVETKKQLATVVGDTGKAFAWLVENGTKRPGSFAWLVLLVVYCLGNFGGWGCLFPDILVWILQKFTGKEVKDTVLSSFYEFNEILDITSELWKNYHFTGNTGRISVFTTRPYSTAIPTLQRVDYIDPRQLVTKKCRLWTCTVLQFFNQYPKYHEHDYNYNPPWDPFDWYSSDAYDTD